MAWAHSNVWAGAHLEATYDLSGTHFQLSDPLGTRRVETNAAGAKDGSYQSLPFGDNFLATGHDATENHFTGKVHDSEWGNDYFGARYYNNSVGRWLSPDWSAKEEPVPYAKMDDPQSLNLYSYLGNNPLGGVDADGHGGCTDTPELCADIRDAVAAGKSILDGAIAFIGTKIAQLQSQQQNSGKQADGSYKAPTGPGSEIYKRMNGKTTNSVIEKGECVQACAKFSGVTQHTASWRAGKPVSELTDADKGTAVATFGSNGRYPSGEDRNSGIFMGHDKAGNMLLYEQWPAGHGRAQPVAPFQRSVPDYGPNSAWHSDSDNANAYRVIIVP